MTADHSETEFAQTDLLVCVKCLKGQDAPEDGLRPGERFFEGLSRKDWPEGLRLVPVECLQNCESGCSIALRGGNRWTYVFGRLNETSDVDMLHDGASRYHATQDGLIPWRERPEHFKRNCVARIPPLTIADAPKGVKT